MTDKSFENIVFLDFDGVCNSYKNGSMDTNPPEKYGPDKNIVRRIREICASCNAKIVITSTWRKFPLYGGVVHNGKRYGNPILKMMESFGESVFGTAPFEKPVRTPKGEFIYDKVDSVKRWLKTNKNWFVGRYAILEDNKNEGFQNDPVFKESFWLVNPETGLTETEKEEIMSYLLWGKR